ncbi:uncharacterized protein MYCFIDRAFT_192946 [Pseudocercospora fijiensis CIRAD86]|uniref:Uncharacterized protein n=1 Tax=Pseudocercospora fijiensis (strain CIRAD86) TaxID=383855 RepID=N1Q7Z0_PSEFD|nr:uncharacterized protein MYCFIDRAFT_192946 [Pseudocercospora fijiensis CIRAD86]EME88894.1 hypothetical protein MYCFIDRAFT_192946 [Pseudocercospora fijiensis CIRAD86]
MPASANNSSVSVFHFTSRISNAKIAKYKSATERGMAHSSTRNSKSRLRRAASPKSNGSDLTEDSPRPSHESPSVEPPPAKKPRLKLNVRSPKPKQDNGDTIAVSRPRRETRKRYSEPLDDIDVEMTEDTPEIESGKAASPAPSSGLSSLSSAPPTPPREESPLKDESPPGSAARADYGDFMSYYIAGGDEESENEKSQAAPKGKRKSKSQAKPKVETAKTSKALKQLSRSSTEATPQNATPVHQTPSVRHPQPQQQPVVEQAPNANNQRVSSHQVQNGPSQTQNVPSAPPRYPQGPPPPGMQRPPPLPLPNPPPPMPQPVIHFIDITHDPKPSKPDTIADMIHKLETLSSALTNFGGVPAVPATPPPDGKPAPPSKARAKKQTAPQAGDQIDGFLSLFGADDDEDDSESSAAEDAEEQQGENVNDQQKNPGDPDGPLTYGIQFIQNALKSWAQQRTTHQITHQLQMQHNQALSEYYNNQQQRGPGRPRKFVEPLPGQPGGPRPILQMDLADTPEGVAIKAFQRVLDSGCLQVNARLHAGLSRALRHLYMQIDHLINQGSKENSSWQCMSYSAQLSAHRFRVEQVRRANAKAQEQQQQLAAQMLPGQQTTNPPHSQAQQLNAIELERRRSMQHAQQQPYIAAQHLNPLQLNGSPPATPAGPSPSPAPGGMPQVHAAGQSMQNGATAGPANAGVQLTKMKMYVPGFLPRSGQSMKFSFAPHSEAAVQAFGSEAFPVEQAPGPQMPNRGPMQPVRTNNLRPASNGTSMSDPQPTTIDLTSDGPEHASSQPAHAQVHVPVLKTGSGFTAVNKPPPASAVSRSTSLPNGSAKEASPETIRVARKHSSGAASASASPALGNGSSRLAARMPHPGAIVEDK